MGTELNSAFKFLVSLHLPEQLTCNEFQMMLISYFDWVKYKYSKSIKVWHIVQQKGETIANFALRLQQSAAYFEYGLH